jgi:hypothetical protein
VPRSLAVAAAALAVAHWVVVSGLGEDVWWAGSAYGPRFMADLVPVLALLSLPVVERLASGRTSAGVRAAVAALAVASVLANLPGAWARPTACWNVDPVDVDRDPSRVWDWSDLQVLRPLRVLADTGSVREMLFQRCDELIAATTPATAGYRTPPP